MDFRGAARLTLGALLGAEALGALSRFEDRKAAFAAARARASATGRTLVVVGDPNAGAHTRLVAAYGCGDVCLDLAGCPACPAAHAADLAAGPGPVPDDSAVVFVSCVLEYVPDSDAALEEVFRMAGSAENVFVVNVQPWTLTGALYPGARHVFRPLPAAPGKRPPGWVERPVGPGRKAAAAGLLLALLAASVWPRPAPPGAAG